MIAQRTLKKVAKATGIGVHSGQSVEITICPAPANSGIVFERIDLDPVVKIPAHSKFVADSLLNTSLMKDKARVATIEHLLSAFSGLAIDNARVLLTGSELPIFDGSAWPFVRLMQKAGIEEQSVAKEFIRILKPITVNEGDKFVALSPYDGFKVSYTLAYDHPVFANMAKTVSLDISFESYAKEVSKARTFGFLSDYEKLQAMNLGHGASLDNTIVIDEKCILNEEGLRYDDEFAKHKILDAIGDLFLCGRNIIGAFAGHKSGHAMNNQLVKKLLATEDAWEYTLVAFRAKASS